MNKIPYDSSVERAAHNYSKHYIHFRLESYTKKNGDSHYQYAFYWNRTKWLSKDEIYLSWGKTIIGAVVNWFIRKNRFIRRRLNKEESLKEWREIERILLEDNSFYVCRIID